MSKNSGAELPKLLHWTRAGIVEGAWGPYESFEALVFTEHLRAQLQKLALGLMGSEDICRKAKLPWRRGAFVFGPPGSGKSAAARAIAMLLSWKHYSVPAHEILDTHHLTRALFDVTRSAPCVVVLENIEEIFKRIDERYFFDTFDLAAERADGVFWIATSRRPEEVPKNQLVRPGRFEETVRIGHPDADVKKKYYDAYLAPFMQAAAGEAGIEALKSEHVALLESNPNLSFAHLQEMRLLIAKVMMDSEPDRLVTEFQTFCEEQVIGGNRWGGSSSQTVELEERVKTADPRLLVSALQVTDAFKRIVEMTLANASEALAAGAEPSGQ